MKKIFFYCTIMMIPVLAWSQPASRSEIVNVAKRHLQQFAKESMEVSGIIDYPDTEVARLYIVGMTNGSWCMVSADKRIDPVLAYGFSPLDEDNIPPGLNDLMYNYKSIMDSIRASDTDNQDTPSPLWGTILSAPRSESPYCVGNCLLDIESVYELSWGQEKNINYDCTPSYNQRCPPEDSITCPYPPLGNVCECNHKPVGCGAVAIGQTMWYWLWPESTDYRTYHWENMPNEITSTTPANEADEIAYFLSDCGEASDMTYCCQGSWTTSENLAEALRETFGYSSAHRYKITEWEYGLSWLNLIKSEIDNRRPVVYYADTSDFRSGHYFVIDGYKVDNGQLFYHVNWGHNGTTNCYCKLDILKENLNGTIYNYVKHHRAIVGISPTYNKANITQLNYNRVTEKQHCRKEYAYNTASISNLTVEPNACFKVEAGTGIRLRPGFVAQRRSNVHISINPAWQSQMEISVPHWPLAVEMGSSGIYVQTVNADSWEFTLKDSDSSIVYQSAGSIGDDGIAHLWDGTGMQLLRYKGIVRFKNSYGRALSQDFDIFVINPSRTPLDEEEGKSVSSSKNNDSEHIINVYPNPTEGQVAVEIPQMTEGKVSIQIIDIFGRQVMECHEDAATSSYRKTIDASSLPSGCYYVVVYTNENREVKCIIKQ